VGPFEMQNILAQSMSRFLSRPKGLLLWVSVTIAGSFENKITYYTIGIVLRNNNIAYRDFKSISKKKYRTLYPTFC